MRARHTPRPEPVDPRVATYRAERDKRTAPEQDVEALATQPTVGRRNRPAERQADRNLAAQGAKVEAPLTAKEIQDFRAWQAEKAARQYAALAGIQSVEVTDGAPQGMVALVITVNVPKTATPGPQGGRPAYLRDNIKGRFFGRVVTWYHNMLPYEPLKGSPEDATLLFDIG